MLPLMSLNERERTMETEVNLETLFPDAGELARAARLAYELFTDASHNMAEVGQAMGISPAVALALTRLQQAKRERLND